MKVLHLFIVPYGLPHLSGSAYLIAVRWYLLNQKCYHNKTRDGILAEIELIT